MVSYVNLPIPSSLLASKNRALTAIRIKLIGLNVLVIIIIAHK